MARYNFNTTSKEATALSIDDTPYNLSLEDLAANHPGTFSMDNGYLVMDAAAECDGEFMEPGETESYPLTSEIINGSHPEHPPR